MKPRLLWWCCVLLGAGAAVPAHALDPHLRLTQYGHDVWQQRDGLPSTVILAIAQTPDGYLWLGTPVGLVRFDGVRFTVVPTFPTDPERKEYVTCLAVSADGALWVGTRFAGLRRVFHGVTEVVDIQGMDPVTLDLSAAPDGKLYVATTTNYYVLAPNGKILRQASGGVGILTVNADRQGRIWIGRQSGAEVVQPSGTSTPVLSTPTNGVNHILFDRRGNVWFATDFGLASWRDGEVRGDGAGPIRTDLQLLSLREDRDGNIWVGSVKGLARLTGNVALDAVPRDLLPLGEVLALCEDSEGSLWIGTRDGLHRLRDVNAVPWGAPEGLPGNHTPAVLAAQDGTIYATVSPPGTICALTPQGVTSYPQIVDGPPYVARDGTLWVGTTGKLSRVRHGVVDQFTTADGILPAWISAIAEDDQSLLLAFSNSSGVWRWDGRQLSPYLLRDGRQFEVGFHITELYSAPDKSVWAVGYDGLLHFDHGIVTRYTTPAGVEDRKEWYQQHPQSPTCFRTVTSSAMADYWLIAMADDHKGTLWLASQRGGLMRFRDGVFASITTREGLKTNQLAAIEVDDDGNVWLGTPGGILRVDGQSIDAVIAKRATSVRCDVLNREDGLRNDECGAEYQPGATKAPNGTLWFSTKNSIVAIDPRHMRRNTLRPPVHIEQVLVDRVDYRATVHPVLPPGHEKFEFHFTALCLAAPDRVRFKYQLVGYDKDWIDAGNTRVTQYTRLPAGKYEFRVRAANNDGVWNDTGASFAFTLRPHFFETWWFALLVVGGAVAAGLGLHRWRVRELNRRKVILQQRIAERTAELSRANTDLQREIEERVRAEKEVHRIHRDLVTASHQAGMAEVATGVLHNVGNALNSVNVSTDLLEKTLMVTKLQNLPRVAQLLREHEANLVGFLTEDPKGRQLPQYLLSLGTVATGELELLSREVKDLRRNVEHIREIVAMQQNYARIGVIAEEAKPAELMDDALRINSNSLSRHGIQVVREYDEKAPAIFVQKHKVLQILVNFIQNAKHACTMAERPDSVIRLRVLPHPRGAEFQVIDNGVGISPELREKIFKYGFTTRKDGHGFGLHTGVLAAREMNGEIVVDSEGEGKGACFALILPLTVPADAATPAPAAEAKT